MAIKNMAASVLTRLKNQSKEEGIGIEIKNPKLIETFFDDEYPFYHYIFRVEKYSGSPVKGYYDGIYWQKLDEINCEGMSWIALQVYQKVSECAYCLKICDKKPEIDIFIQEYMSHDAGRMGGADEINSPFAPLSVRRLTP